MQITKRSKDAPCEIKMIYQDPSAPPSQPPTTNSGDDSPQPTISGEGYGVPNAVRDAIPDERSDVPKEVRGALRPSRPSARTSSTRTSSARSSPSDLPDLERHARKCCICSHPDRDAIEGEFIRWDCPRRIARDYQIADRATFYRHAHATGLYARRRREFARVLENILECVEHSTLEETADVIIRASRVYARLDENGNWVEPSRTHIILTGPAPTQLTGNPELEVSVEPQPHRELNEITLYPAKKRTYSCKSKRDLTEMTIRKSKANKNLPARSKEGPRRSGRLIATPQKLKNGLTS